MDVVFLSSIGKDHFRSTIFYRKNITQANQLFGHPTIYETYTNFSFYYIGEMLADSTVTVSGGTPPFFMPPPTSVAGSAAAAAAATRALIMNPAAYPALAAAAPFLYGNNALRYWSLELTQCFLLFFRQNTP